MISKVGNSAAVAAAALDRRTAVSANDTRCTIVISIRLRERLCSFFVCHKDARDRVA